MANLGELAPFDDANVAKDIVQFFNINSINGWPASSLTRIVEEITSMGVDGTRLRTLRNDYPKFVMTTLTASADFGAAVTAAEAIRALKGYRATLKVIAAGVEYTFSSRKVYIWEAIAEPLPGTIVSTIALDGTGGLVKTTWTLQFIG